MTRNVRGLTHVAKRLGVPYEELVARQERGVVDGGKVRVATHKTVLVQLIRDHPDGVRTGALYAKYCDRVNNEGELSLSTPYSKRTVLTRLKELAEERDDVWGVMRYLGRRGTGYEWFATGDTLCNANDAEHADPTNADNAKRAD